jgi:hypothetical protein
MTAGTLLRSIRLKTILVDVAGNLQSAKAWPLTSPSGSLLGVTLASIALADGDFPAIAGGPKVQLAHAIPAQFSMARPARPARGLTQDQSKRMAAAIQNMTPKQRKQLTRATKHMTQEQLGQLREAVKRQPGGPQMPAQMPARGRYNPPPINSGARRILHPFGNLRRHACSGMEWSHI